MLVQKKLLGRTVVLRGAGQSDFDDLVLSSKQLCSLLNRSCRAKFVTYKLFQLLSVNEALVCVRLAKVY